MASLVPGTPMCLATAEAQNVLPQLQYPRAFALSLAAHCHAMLLSVLIKHCNLIFFTLVTMLGKVWTSEGEG